MEIDKIKSLKSIDLFKLILYSFIGLGIPLLLLMLVLQLTGVPVTINEVNYYGLTGLLYSLLFVPIFIIAGTLALWFYIAIGWKIARWGLKSLGRL